MDSQRNHAHTVWQCPCGRFAVSRVYQAGQRDGTPEHTLIDRRGGRDRERMYRELPRHMAGDCDQRHD